MQTTTAPAYKVDWVELELSAIVNRYGWEATLNGLQSLLPLGETLADLLETIEDRAGYRSDCF